VPKKLPHGFQITLQGKNMPFGRYIEAASHQCHLIKAYIATVFSELYRIIKKLSGKADLVIYSYSVVVPG